MFTSKTIISLIIGGAVSAVALYFAFRNVPFEELTAYLAAINYLWVIPSVVLVVSSSVSPILALVAALPVATGYLLLLWLLHLLFGPHHARLGRSA